jgi:hypothetical protein
MDTSNSNITFNARGRYDYCDIVPDWHPDEQGAQEIARIAGRMQAQGKGRTHDCLIWISGVDSLYVT